MPNGAMPLQRDQVRPPDRVKKGREHLTQRLTFPCGSRSGDSVYPNGVGRDREPIRPNDRGMEFEFRAPLVEYTPAQLDHPGPVVHVLSRLTSLFGQAGGLSVEYENALFPRHSLCRSLTGL